MPWIQAVFEIDAGQAEELEDALEQLGALSVTLADSADQPLYEPKPGETPLWQKVKASALFDASIATDHITDQLTDHYRSHSQQHAPIAQFEIVEDKDWVREWMTQFQPIRYGQRLWICPSWLQPPQPDAVNLMLDPGLAFGTGTHATTSLCLEWLEGNDLSGINLIDYGCGSGVLAIAALLLGAEQAVAIDIDPQALQATRENADKNQIAPERLNIKLADIELASIDSAKDTNDDKEPPAADLVIANILAGPLQELANTLASLTKPQGWLLLSGILTDQAENVLSAYRPWFKFKPIVEKEGWVLLEGCKIH